jgi:hypothetical protein
MEEVKEVAMESDGRVKRHSLIVLVRAFTYCVGQGDVITAGGRTSCRRVT